MRDALTKTLFKASAVGRSREGKLLERLLQEWDRERCESSGVITMSHYRNPNGKPQWRGRGGQLATSEKMRLWSLVKHGRAEWYRPMRTLREAIEKAGL